jgi:flagellar biosynthesis protein FlhG
LTIAADRHGDQAAGLRRLLHCGAPRVFAFCSVPGMGRSVLCASFAGALARVGRRVVVLDCTDSGAASVLAGAVRPDLLDAARSGLGPGELVAQIGAVAVVQARQAFRATEQFAVRERERLGRALAAICTSSDCVLVDTAGDDLALAAACDELVVVIRPHAEGMLASYRLLKRMAPWVAARSVRVLVNGARPGVQSMRFFGNLSATARRFLGLSLEFAGEVPEDESLQRASRLKQPVVSVFPGSPAARAMQTCALGLLGRDDAETFGMQAFIGRLSAAGAPRREHAR